jgi:DNA-binding NtrC family response regulator
MDIVLQSKLLRVIQERCITPLGSEKSLPLDVRIVSATNKNLEEEMKKGNFREDLYFRLNVIKIETPPLRKRKEDIPALIMHFMAKYSVLFGKKINGISPEAVETLEGYSYPGNIRQLENIIERAVALSQDDIIKISDLPKEIKRSSIGVSNLVPVYIGDSLDEAEKKLTLATLSHFKGNKAETSKVLGLSERHLRTKIKEYSVEE